MNAEGSLDLRSVTYRVMPGRSRSHFRGVLYAWGIRGEITFGQKSRNRRRGVLLQGQRAGPEVPEPMHRPRNAWRVKVAWIGSGPSGLNSWTTNWTKARGRRAGPFRGSSLASRDLIEGLEGAPDAREPRATPSRKRRERAHTARPLRLPSIDDLRSEEHTSELQSQSNL